MFQAPAKCTRVTDNEGTKTQRYLGDGNAGVECRYVNLVLPCHSFIIFPRLFHLNSKCKRKSDVCELAFQSPSFLSKTCAYLPLWLRHRSKANGSMPVSSSRRSCDVELTYHICDAAVQRATLRKSKIRSIPNHIWRSKLSTIHSMRLKKNFVMFP
jgi:hypothetical protein